MSAMKFKLIHTSLAVVLGAALVSGARAQSCPLPEAIKPVSVNFESYEGTPTLIGFSEFTSPSTPPKKYRNRNVSGAMTVEEFGQSTNCSPDPCPPEGTIAFSNGSTVYGGGPFSGSA